MSGVSNSNMLVRPMMTSTANSVASLEIANSLSDLKIGLANST